MAATTLRDALYDYIRYADDKKVKAIYTMVEEEINQKHDPWENEEFLMKLEERVDDIKSGKVKGLTWDEVKQKAASLCNRLQIFSEGRLCFNNGYLPHK